MKTQNSNPQISKEEIQVKMEMLKYYFTKEGGLVLLYKIVPPEDAILSEFFIVAFDDNTGEYVWGIGHMPEKALEDAERKWDSESETEERKDNPFRQVRQVLEQKGE